MPDTTTPTINEDHMCPNSIKFKTNGIQTVSASGIASSLMGFGLKTLNVLGGFEIGGVSLNEFIKRIIYQVLADNFPEYFFYKKLKLRCIKS